MMENMTYNPDNIIYNTYINGTSNLSTIEGAPVLASKGHFYQIADNLGDTIPIIRDHSGNKIEVDPNRDDTFISIEQISGLTVVALQRL